MTPGKCGAVAAASLLILAGCAASPEDLGAPPANYRELAKAHVKSAFFDPYSVRDAEIAAPVPSKGPVLLPTGEMTAAFWVVCLRANAKNKLGAYTGMKETALVVRGNRVVHSWEEHAWAACDGAKYEPFPDLTV